MFFRVKKTGGYEYLQLVQNKRINGTVHQHVVASLGRLDYLISSGKLASLIASVAKLAGQELVDNAENPDPCDVRGPTPRQSSVKNRHLPLPSDL